MSVISTENLTLSIGPADVCQNLNWEINQGDRWAILGVNGSGKTTLLHTLAGLHHSFTGNIKLQNKPVNTLTRKNIACQLGLLLQHQEDHFPGTVLETVLIGRHPHLKSWQWESENDLNIAREALKKVGLRNFEERSIQTLSGGERQRVALATLITQQTSILLLDEPVNHLDIHQQHEIMQFFVSENLHHTLLFVLHDVNLATRYCNKALLLLRNGETLLGDCDKVLTEKNLATLYQHPIHELSHQGRRWFIPG